jgi:chitinase
MHYWAEMGADKKKLIMGMPMYGQTFTMNSPSPAGLGAPGGKGLAGEFTRQEGFTAYYEVSAGLPDGFISDQ